MDLFETKGSSHAPLAARMRPSNLDEYIGQKHILGEGRLLRRVITADQLGSLIFYGPPGTGKTTLAQVIAGHTKSQFQSLNAVLSGVKELRETIELARQARDLYGRRTILFVDEVHRWNKSQQDALLPWVENGTCILIGATTQNPFFEVNPALVSRSRVFSLNPLEEEELLDVARRALGDRERGYGHYRVVFQEGALEHLVRTAGGDARSLLNALELAVEGGMPGFPPAEGTEIPISMEDAEESIQQKAILYDKDGDYHFDTISAFIKSLRGSDPDAALFWLAKMIRAGEDPRFIFRRMLISASEDIGLADPQALVQVQSAAQSFDRVGLPEGQFFLTQAALYLALCPKSNSTLAYFDALKSLEEDSAEVPNHLKDANRDSQALGHGKGYQYPHAFRDHWVAQQYLPDTLKGRLFYQPGSLGWEGEQRSRHLERREALWASQAGSEAEEPGPRSPSANRGNPARIPLGQAYSQIRDRLFQGLETQLPAPPELIIVLKDQRGLLSLEALRRYPGVPLRHFRASPQDRDWILHQSEEQSLVSPLEWWDDVENILVTPPPQKKLLLLAWNPLELSGRSHGGDPEFPWSTTDRNMKPNSHEAWSHLAWVQVQNGLGQRLSPLLQKIGLGFPEEFIHFEESYFQELLQRETERSALFCKSLGLTSPASHENMEFQTPLKITDALVRQWLDPQREEGLGAYLEKTMAPELVKTLRHQLLALNGRELPWKRSYGLHLT